MPIASGANSVASALGNRTRRDPGTAMRTYHEGLKPTRKTGTFYFGPTKVTLGTLSATVGRQPEKINPLLFACAKTVSEGHLFQPRSLLVERKQIPQIVVIVGTWRKPMAPLEITRLPWAQGGRAFKSPRPDQCFQRDAVIFIKWPSASVVKSVAVSILKIQRRADKLAIKRVRIA